MPTPFQQIVSLLPKLTQADRKKLLTLVNTFSGKMRVTAGSSTLNSDWLFDGIIAELGRRGLRYKIQKLDRVLALAPNYEDDSEFVRQTLKDMMRTKANPRVSNDQLQTLGFIAARSLADSFVTGDMSLKRMLVNVSRTLEALDSSFPDYMGTGMLSMLVQLHMTKQNIAQQANARR